MSKVSPGHQGLLMQASSKTSPKRPSDGASSSPGMRIIANPNAELYSSYNEMDEPVWLRHTDISKGQDMVNAAKLAMQRKNTGQEGVRSTAGVIMGQTALAMKSPETRRKQNGIVTNPNYSKSSAGGVNGYYTTPTEGTDNCPVTPNGNSSIATGTEDVPPPLPAKPKAVRPTGLPLKKETPL